jgi:choline-sulfatase
VLRVTDPPNVIVFFTDQQRWDTAGVYGNPLSLTPHLDSMARRGTLFEYAFTPQPVCGPARTALQTGLYPSAVGCYRNGIPLPRDATTMAHRFGAAGYHTAYIGKWHLASRDPVPPEDRGGYQTWLAANRLEWTSHPYDTRLFDDDGKEVRLPGYRTDALIDAAIRHIDRMADSPFFLFLSLLEPHHQNDIDQYVAPARYEELYGRGWCPGDLETLVGSARQHLPGYLGMVKRIDEGLGRLLDALYSQGILDNTIVLFTSDHGCHFRTRNHEYKRSCHEASIRIPMVAQGPYFDSRGVVSELVTLLDVPTMLAAAAGIEPPPGAVGRHLDAGEAQNRLRGGLRVPGAETEGILIQITEEEIGRALRTRRWKYAVAAPDADPRQTGSASCYYERHLYDLEADPWELRNLIAEPAYETVRDQLRAELLTRMAAVGEGHVRIGRWHEADPDAAADHHKQHELGSLKGAHLCDG